MNFVKSLRSSLIALVSSAMITAPVYAAPQTSQPSQSDQLQALNLTDLSNETAGEVRGEYVAFVYWAAMAYTYYLRYGVVTAKVIEAAAKYCVYGDGLDCSGKTYSVYDKTTRVMVGSWNTLPSGTPVYSSTANSTPMYFMP